MAGWRRKRKAQAALPFITACALLGATVAANASSYVVTIEEVGANVVATGSGNIDLTGLTPFGTFGAAAGVNPTFGIIDLQNIASENALTGTISGPSNFGPGVGGTFIVANTTSGNFVGFSPTEQQVRIFPGYVSDSALGISKDTWDNATFASLGITPGTYTWTWDNGADSFTITTTPLPAALPLFATGLGGLGLLGWRRKRKAQAVA